MTYRGKWGESMDKLREVGPGVFYSDSPIVSLCGEELDWLQREAESSPLGRARICAHADTGENVHEMLICLARRTYIRPHLHFKSESLHVIRGACDLVLFDGSGDVFRVTTLGEAATGESFYVRLSEPTYHTLLLKTDSLLFHETTPGPLDRAATSLAPWAPPEEDGEAVASFVEEVRTCAAHWLSHQRTEEA